MIKWRYTTSLILLILSGCSRNTIDNKHPVTSSNYSSSSSIEITTANSETNQNEHTTTTAMLEINENEITTTDRDTYPYAVNINDIIISEDMGGVHPVIVNAPTFVSSGINCPKKIDINQGVPYSLGICVYVYSSNMSDSYDENSYVMYPVSIENIPTKEINLFGGTGTDGKKRTVKVNTELTLHSYEHSEAKKNSYYRLNGHKFYLFYNYQGTVSLATENFAGNVDQENIETMMEYVQE